METFGLVGTLDDLDRLLAHADERLSQLGARVAAIGEHIAQPRKPRPDCGQHVDSSIAILNVGSVNQNEDRETASAGQDVPVTALDLLARVKARYSATSVVFTDRLSITPALGEASRPSISRRFMTSTVLIASNKPALR